MQANLPQCLVPLLVHECDACPSLTELMLPLFRMKMHFSFCIEVIMPQGFHIHSGTLLLSLVHSEFAPFCMLITCLTRRKYCENFKNEKCYIISIGALTIFLAIVKTHRSMKWCIRQYLVWIRKWKKTTQISAAALWPSSCQLHVDSVLFCSRFVSKVVKELLSVKLNWKKNLGYWLCDIQNKSW